MESDPDDAVFCARAHPRPTTTDIAQENEWTREAAQDQGQRAETVSAAPRAPPPPPHLPVPRRNPTIGLIWVANYWTAQKIPNLTFGHSNFNAINVFNL